MQRRSFVKVVAAAFALPMMPGSKIEPDKVIIPKAEELVIVNDRIYPRAAFYGYMTMGCAVLDNRKVLLGTFE